MEIMLSSLTSIISRNKDKYIQSWILNREGYQIKLKDMYLTLADTRGKLITRVKMEKNRMRSLTIHYNIPKCIRNIINDKDWL
jgi:hypothetical protein